MKALLCTEHGSVDNVGVGETETPVPKEGEVLIEVEAASIGFVDTLMIADAHQVHHPVPFSPGMTAVGRVVAVGDNTDGFEIGARVASVMGDGGLAEYATAATYETFLLPDDCDSTITAGVLMSALTAELSLSERARVRDGETVLVGGAAGAVGVCVIQLAKAMNARVIAAASSPERCDVAKAAGADAAVVYGDDLRDRVKTVNDGRDVDVILDPVGGEFAGSAIHALDWNGRYVIIGFAAGMAPPFQGNRLLIKNRAVLGMVLGYYRWQRPEILAASAGRVLAAIAESKLSPPLDVMSALEDVPDVLRRIAARSFTGIAAVQLR